MFADRYGLTAEVKAGHKLRSRRICKEQYWSFSDLVNANENQSFMFEIPRYKIGDIVAVAQRYSDFMDADETLFRLNPKTGNIIRQTAIQHKGWKNKMFVAAEIMPCRIRITNVRVERLKDITDEECIKEGLTMWQLRGKRYYGFFDSVRENFFRYSTPREAFAALIDLIAGNGTWASNPYVFVYEFELIK